MSDECKGAMAVILAIGVAIGLFLGGISLIVAQGQSQTCSRAGGVWIAHDEPQGASYIEDRKCQR